MLIWKQRQDYISHIQMALELLLFLWSSKNNLVQNKYLSQGVLIAISKWPLIGVRRGYDDCRHQCQKQRRPHPWGNRYDVVREKATHEQTVWPCRKKERWFLKTEYVHWGRPNIAKKDYKEHNNKVWIIGKWPPQCKTMCEIRIHDQKKSTTTLQQINFKFTQTHAQLTNCFVL